MGEAVRNKGAGADAKLSGGVASGENLSVGLGGALQFAVMAMNSEAARAVWAQERRSVRDWWRGWGKFRLRCRRCRCSLVARCLGRGLGFVGCR